MTRNWTGKSSELRTRTSRDTEFDNDGSAAAILGIFGGILLKKNKIFELRNFNSEKMKLMLFGYGLDRAMVKSDKLIFLIVHTVLFYFVAANNRIIYQDFFFFYETEN